MKKNKTFQLFPLLILTIILVHASSCEKDNDGPVNTTNGKTTAVFNPDITYGTMTDQEGNIYKTVTIGTNTWMAENLRTTIYKDSTAIPNVIDGEEWSGLTTGAYCNYNNTSSEDTIASYGRLYNWHAVNTGKLAPPGWRIPNDGEWRELINYLGGLDEAGGYLKESDTIHWNSPNKEATNESGFTALPGGVRSVNGSFYSLGLAGYWWSSTDGGGSHAWYMTLNSHYSNAIREHLDKERGFCVRCVKN